MSFKPLKQGQMYTVGPDGDLVEVTQAPEKVQPVPVEDLPPDMRPEATPAEQKLDALNEGVRKLTETLNQASVRDEASVVDLTIPEEDRMAFLKAIISNKPYRKQFKIFDGNVAFSFKTLSTAELDAVSEAIVIQSGRVPYSTMLAMAGAHMRFCMTCSLCDIEFNDEETGITKKLYKSIDAMYPDKARKDTFYVRDPSGNMIKKEITVQATPGQKVIWAAQEKFADVSVPLYNILFEKYQKFDAEILQMTKESGSPNFFLTGGDGSSS